MDTVQAIEPANPAPVKSYKHRGKPPMDPEKRRVQLSIRVKRDTRDALAAFGAKNIGIAIDELVVRATDAGILAA